MKKIAAIITTLLFTSISINAQKIEMKKVFGGYQFTQSEKTINANQMQEIMKGNQEALELITSAKKNQTWAMVLGTAGGALIGYPLGTAIGGGDPEWVLAGAGVALIAISIPIVKGFNKKAKNAVELYNADVTSNAYNFNPSFNFNIKGANLGLTMSF